MQTKAALIQLNASDDPVSNLPVTQGFMREAAAGGARFILTPEVTNCLSSSRVHQNAVLQHQDDDLMALERAGKLDPLLSA
jgi:predicted amidohydrolase